MEAAEVPQSERAFVFVSSFKDASVTISKLQQCLNFFIVPSPLFFGAFSYPIVASVAQTHTLFLGVSLVFTV